MNQRLKKITRRILYVSGTVFILFILTLLVAPLFIRPLVKEIIRTKITEATSNLYVVDFELTQLSFIPGKITIRNFKMVPDENRLPELNPANYYELESDELKVSGIRFFSFLWRGSWSVRKTELHTSTIKVFHKPDGVKLKSGDKKNALRLKMDRLVMTESRVEIWNASRQQQRFRCVLKEAEVKNIRIRPQAPLTLDESQLHFNPVDVLLTGKKELHLQDVYIRTSGRNGSIHATHLNVNQLVDALGDESESYFKQNVLEVEVDSLAFSITDYSLWPYLLKKSNKGAYLSQAYLKHPVLTYYPGRSAASSDSSGLNPLQNRSSTRFNIRELIIENGEVNVWSGDEKYKSVYTGNVDITAEDFGTSPLDYKVPVWASSLSVNADSLKIRTSGGIFAIDVQSLSLQKSNQEIRLNGFYMTPVVSPDSFYVYKGFQIDYPQLTVPSIQVKGIRYYELLRTLRFTCREVHAYEPYLRLFRDKHYPLNTVKRPDFPQQQLKQIETLFYIDSAKVTDGVIRYDELTKNSNDTGHFEMTSVNASTIGFTNREDILEKNDTIRFWFSSKFYGQGSLDGVLTLLMNSPDGRHKVEGKIGPLNVKVFNAITKPSALMVVKNGIVHGGEFSFWANYEKAEGTLLLRFEKLKVALLDSKNNGRKLRVNILKTLVANIFLVKENPEKGKPPMVSVISYQRDPSRWVINYWWKSLLNGIDNIILQRKGQMMEIKRDADAFKQMRKGKNKK